LFYVVIDIRVCKKRKRGQSTSSEVSANT